MMGREMFFSKEVERFVALGDDGKQYTVCGWVIKRRIKPVDPDLIADQYILDTGQELVRISINEFVIKDTGIRLSRIIVNQNNNR